MIYQKHTHWIFPILFVSVLIAFIVFGFSGYKRALQREKEKEQQALDKIRNPSGSAHIAANPLLTEAMRDPEKMLTESHPKPLATSTSLVPPAFAGTQPTSPERAEPTSAIVKTDVPCPALDATSRMASGFASLRDPAIADLHSPERLEMVRQLNEAGARGYEDWKRQQASPADQKSE